MWSSFLVKRQLSKSFMAGLSNSKPCHYAHKKHPYCLIPFWIIISFLMVKKDGQGKFWKIKFKSQNIIKQMDERNWFSAPIFV